MYDYVDMLVALKPLKDMVRQDTLAATLRKLADIIDACNSAAAELNGEELAYIKSNQLISAIKSLRGRTNLSLKEAKDIVDLTKSRMQNALLHG